VLQTILKKTERLTACGFLVEADGHMERSDARLLNRYQESSAFQD
jgi:hypothetical protein